MMTTEKLVSGTAKKLCRNHVLHVQTSHVEACFAAGILERPPSRVACEACGETAGNCTHQGEFEECEPLEWWLITRWMAEQLAPDGEAIATDGWSYWWGRECSGQAVDLDPVVRRMAASVVRRP
jgi:hypothetical protein